MFFSCTTNISFFVLIINVLELKHNAFLQPFMDAVLSIGMG